MGTGILVTKRSRDYHACLDGHPGVWGCGRTPDEAVGAFLRNHPEHQDAAGSIRFENLEQKERDKIGAYALVAFALYGGHR